MFNDSLVLLQPNLKQAEAPDLEPGLLPVFRLAMVLQIAVQVVSVAFGLLFEPGIAWETFASIVLVGFLLTLGYLSWPLLWRILGRVYLPLGLLLVAAVPMFERGLFVYAQLQQAPFQLTSQDVFGVAWRLIVGFFVPLVLMAWQYTLRTVLSFIALFFLLTQALGLWLYGLTFYQMRDLVELTLLLPILFVIIGYIITRMMGIQRAQQQALREANTQLVATNRKLAEHAATVEQLAVSRERNRMARDLHDTLAHTLTAVAVQLEAADSAWCVALEQAHMLLLKALGTARSGLDETRRAIKALRAAPLEDLGLTLAICACAESIAARTGAQLVADLTDDFNLPPEVEQTVYRIAQEVLNNIAKHANAQKLWVTLGKRNQEMILVISDDGVGFALDQDAPDGHYGLEGLREQAQLIGAQLQIASQPQRGTTVRLTLAHGKEG